MENNHTVQDIFQKFGTDYIEEINHYEDDDGYDVFVPIEEINNEI